MTLRRKLWVGIAFLALVSPLGLLIPRYFKAGPAWGEWTPQEIEGKTGYVPQGLLKEGSYWKAPLREYAFGESEGGLAYAGSAFLGVVLIATIMSCLGRILKGKND